MVRNSNDIVQTIISHRVLTPRYQKTVVLESLEPHLSNKKNSSKNINFKQSNFDFQNFVFFEKFRKISKNPSQNLDIQCQLVPAGASWRQVRAPAKTLLLIPAQRDPPARSFHFSNKSLAIVFQLQSHRNLLLSPQPHRNPQGVDSDSARSVPLTVAGGC